MVSVLKAIGLLDSDGKPTKTYEDFRIQAKSAETMKKCVQDVYRELFDMYPDACAAKDGELVAFFSQANPKGGEETIRCTVGTFRLLCTYAGQKVSEEQLRPSKPREAEKREARAKPQLEKKIRTQVRTTQGVTINLNIQLNLPVTDDPTVYDKIFEALRKHLFE